MTNEDRYTEDRNGGRNFTLTSLGTDWEPPFESVTSVAVVPIDVSTSRVVAVNLKDRGLDLPGGHTRENDESALDTARRECAEEASISIENPLLVDVIQSDFYGSNPEELTYMLIYSADVANLLPFAANDESSERMLVRPSDFLEAYVGGDRESMRVWLCKAIESRGIGWT